MNARVSVYDRLSQHDKDVVVKVAKDMAVRELNRMAEDLFTLHKAMFVKAMHDAQGMGAKRISAVLDNIAEQQNEIDTKYDGSIGDYTYRVIKDVEKLGITL